MCSMYALQVHLIKYKVILAYYMDTYNKIMLAITFVYILV